MIVKKLFTTLTKWATPCPGCDESDEKVLRSIEIETATRNWRMCRELADRYNRRLVQYGAAAATALGVGGASGGLLATADAIVRNSVDNEQIPGFIIYIIGVLIGLSSFIFIAGTVLLLAALGIRGRAENRAAAFLNKVIELRPELFLPSSEDLRP